MEPVPAATAVLLRDAATLQVYLVRRNPKSGFMGGNYVFPGGMVDPEDLDREGWRGLLASAPGEPPAAEEAFPYAAAAVRETFEEAGVLLGCEPKQEDVRELLARRGGEPLPAGWLQQEARARGWVFHPEALKPWARWITPSGMKRRFEARFFVAVAPGGQSCSPDGREIIDGLWASPEEALQRNLTGEVPLAPPNIVTLHQFLAYERPEGVLAEASARDWSSPLYPRFVPFPGGAVILEPWDPEIDRSEFSFDPGVLARSVLRVGEAFSRLWFDGSVWRPVRSD